MAELVLYTNPMSRGRTARWMLEELGEPYRAELVAYGPALRAPEFLALNPMGKVPVLTHGRAVVSETAAICAYLAAAFPAAGLAPAPGTPESAAYYRWLFFAAGPVEAGVLNNAMGLHVPADKEAMAGYGNFARLMDGLEAAVDKSMYITGDRFSAADVYVGAQVGFGLAFNSIEKRPAFAAYWSRLAQRPAQLRAAAADDALMPAKADA